MGGRCEWGETDAHEGRAGTMEDSEGGNRTLLEQPTQYKGQVKRASTGLANGM